MAIVYDIFGKKKPYDTEKLEEKNESAYFRQLKSQMNSALDYMNEMRMETTACDPLKSIIFVPFNERTDCMVMSLCPGDSKQDLIDALESALKKVKGFDEH